MKKIRFAFLALGLMFGSMAIISPSFALTPFDVEQAIQQGNHQALADYYHSQAEEQRRLVEMHEKMKTSYRETHVHYKGIENTLASHCSNLQLKAREMAKEYDALAADHEKIVKKK